MKVSVDAFIRFQFVHSFVHSFVRHVGTSVGRARNDAHQSQVCQNHNLHLIIIDRDPLQMIVLVSYLLLRLPGRRDVPFSLACSIHTNEPFHVRYIP